jgi:hypothetical protein
MSNQQQKPPLIGDILAKILSRLDQIDNIDQRVSVLSEKVDKSIQSLSVKGPESSSELQEHTTKILSVSKDEFLTPSHHEILFAPHIKDKNANHNKYPPCIPLTTKITRDCKQFSFLDLGNILLTSKHQYKYIHHHTSLQKRLSTNIALMKSLCGHIT